jgi:predicted metallo-beta-lactamase superfamily hydrolase
MNDLIRNLKGALILVADAKIIIAHHVETARLLMDDKQFHELQVIALKIGSDIATIETYLNEFERVGMHSKKFIPAKK